MSSEEYKSRMEEVFGNFGYCSVSQEDRKFYLQDPNWDWDWMNDSYKSGLHDGVRAVMFTPTVTIPFWLKSDQHRAIFRQLRSEFQREKY